MANGHSDAERLEAALDEVATLKGLLVTARKYHGGACMMFVAATNAVEAALRSERDEALRNWHALQQTHQVMTDEWHRARGVLAEQVERTEDQIDQWAKELDAARTALDAMTTERNQLKEALTEVSNDLASARETAE